MSPRRKAIARDMLEELKGKVNGALSGVKSHPFGHAFMWAVVRLVIDGKEVRFKHCLGMICADDFSEVERRVSKAAPEVESLQFNLD